MTIQILYVILHAKSTIMETNVRIKRVIEWIQPYFGNRHTMPYGKLEVTDGVTTKIVKTKGDVLGEFERYGCQYIMFNRKPYELVHYYEGNKHKLKLEPIFN